MTNQPSITCPQCGMTSYHPMDVEHRYCGNCYQYHDMMPKPRVTKGPLKIPQASAQRYLESMEEVSRYFRIEYPVVLHWVFHWHMMRWLRREYNASVDWKRSPTGTLLRRGYKYKVTGTRRDMAKWDTEGEPDGED